MENGPKPNETSVERNYDPNFCNFVPNFSRSVMHPIQQNCSSSGMNQIGDARGNTQSLQFNINDPHSNKAAGGIVLESGYSLNQVSKNHGVPSHVQCSDGQFNSMHEHYSSQIEVSGSKSYPSCHQPPVSSKPMIVANGYASNAPPNPQPIAGSMPFQNSNYHFQPYPLAPPVSSSPLVQTSVSSTQNNHRSLFNVPPPSMMSVGNVNPMQFGQFNFPPPSIPATTYFPHPNNQSQQNCNDASLQTAFPYAAGVGPSQSSSFQPSTMSHMISELQSSSVVPENKSVSSEKENLLNSFLQKFIAKEKNNVKSDITVAEFHSTLKNCFSLFNSLQSSRGNLVSLLHSSQEEWETELICVKELQAKLSEASSVLALPSNLSVIQKKLKSIKRKRILKKKLKASKLEQKVKKEQEREKLHQEIDKWFDNLKEKNEKMKQEIEMKKEADNILSEVRRKIHEAKKTIEKLKVFEKLRSVRQASAVQKGLYVVPEHSAKFEAKISHMRETMLAQLANYEQEEKALQVMLETEQEDRREEEALWRKRKLMALQQKKQKAIVESLLGDSDEPAPDDPLFLFYQYQNSGNKSIDNLVQIRHHWDIHLSEEGESIPLQWVIPVPPNSSSWEEYCIS